MSSTAEPGAGAVAAAIGAAHGWLADSEASTWSAFLTSEWVSAYARTQPLIAPLVIPLTWRRARALLLLDLVGQGAARPLCARRTDRARLALGQRPPASAMALDALLRTLGFQSRLAVDPIHVCH
jgi:hypothetical protein